MGVCCQCLQAEQDLALARFLTGLHGTRARREVSDLVSGIVENGAGLQLTEDKLTNIMEAAQVIPCSTVSAWKLTRAVLPCARRVGGCGT